MKNIIILILILTFVSCKAQQTVNLNTFNQGNNVNKYFKDIDNHFIPFLGTWENTTGEITLRVILYKTERKPYGYPVSFYMDRIEGKFLIIKNAGTILEEIIHDSVKYYPISGQTLTSVILGGSSNGISLGAFIQDNSVDENTIGILEGNLTMKILNIGNIPLQADWKVFRKGLSIQGWDFNVPTDVILTKQ